MRAGDILVLVNGEYVVIEKVQHEILEAPVTVYNFQVKDLINKGINRIVAGKNRYDAESRYWKGAIKRGMTLFRQGVFDLNVAQGTASVIGSTLGGAGSIAKYQFKESRLAV